jgi:trans-2-enoyl-CoA reductase
MCADIAKTVEIIFAGKNELSKTIGGIEREFGQLDSMVNSLAAPLAGVADSILKVDAALLALAIGGLAISVREAGKFSDQFAFVTTLLSTTGAGVDKFKSDIKAYAADSTQSIEQINKSLYNAISGGVEWTKSLEFIAVAERLATAGHSDMSETTKVLISTLNAYGRGIKDAADFSDIFFKTAQYGQMTLSDLTAPLSQITINWPLQSAR